MRSLHLPLLISLALCACRPERTSAPPAAPSMESPAELMPADLDVVLRVDVKRLLSAFGSGSSLILAELLQRLAPRSDDQATRKLLGDLLARADTLWLGLRPAARLEQSDNVWILRGDFDEVVPTTLAGAPPWSPPRDLGGATRRYERAPSERAAPAVLYFRMSDRVVFGSTAEIDALTRRIERGVREGKLRAPDSGLISAAARVQMLAPGLRQRAPVLARWLSRAERLEASVNRSGETFALRLDLRFEDAESAKQVASSVSAAVLSLPGAEGWGSRFSAESLERDVTLRFSPTRAEIDQLFIAVLALGAQ